MASPTPVSAFALWLLAYLGMFGGKWLKVTYMLMHACFSRRRFYFFAVVVAGVKFFPLFLCPLFTFVVGGGAFL